jgi:hypothetical protein
MKVNFIKLFCFFRKNQLSTFTFGEILDSIKEDKDGGDHSKSKVIYVFLFLIGHSLLDKDI